MRSSSPFDASVPKRPDVADGSERIKWVRGKFYAAAELKRIEPGIYEICQTRTYWINKEPDGKPREFVAYRLEKLTGQEASRVLEMEKL